MLRISNLTTFNFNMRFFFFYIKKSIKTKLNFRKMSSGIRLEIKRDKSMKPKNPPLIKIS